MPNSKNKDGAVKTYFVIDQKAALQCCAAAREAMAEGDETQALRLLLQALAVRPSSMLSYQLLSELFAKQGSLDDAALCRKGLLPETALEQMAVMGGNAVSAFVAGSEPIGINRQLLFPAETIALPAPVEIAPAGSETKAPKPTFFSEKSIVSKECFVDQIKAAQLWHDAQNTFVLDAGGNEVVEHSKYDRGLITRVMSNHKPKPIEGRAFLIGARGAHNFYHWMTDIIPKLAVLKEAGFTFDASDRFIVPFANAVFCRQMVEQFGIESTQLYETEKQHAYLQVDELVVPYVDNKMGLTMGSWLPRLMQEQFTPAADDVGSRRLFITRDEKNSDGRQIENQEEIMAVMQQHGFECVQPENYSVAQQAQLFSEAAVVVAVHGAALSNILFCRPGTTVIEFYGAHLAPCYWAISALCDLRYCHHFSGGGNQGLHGTAAGRSGNLSVSLSELDALLRLMGVVQ